MDQTQFATLTELLTRIASAMESQLEAQRPAEMDTITLPIAMFRAFDWTQINCRVFAEDEFGVAQVFSVAEGRVYTRRTNDKFGSEIWFSRGAGKSADGTPKYKKLIEFREINAAEPMGRKAEQALKSAPEAPALNPTAQQNTQPGAQPGTPPATDHPKAPTAEEVLSYINAIKPTDDRAAVKAQVKHYATALGINLGSPASLNEAIKTLKTACEAKVQPALVEDGAK